MPLNSVLANQSRSSLLFRLPGSKNSVKFASADNPSSAPKDAKWFEASEIKFKCTGCGMSNKY